MSPHTNENWVISEELFSKHPEESTKQLVSSLSSSAKPITASDVGLFKANQSQEVFSPLSVSPPAYWCWLGNESQLKWGSLELTLPVVAVVFLCIETTLHYWLPSILQQFCSLRQSFCRSPIASLPPPVRAEWWLLSREFLSLKEETELPRVKLKVQLNTNTLLLSLVVCVLDSLTW